VFHLKTQNRIGGQFRPHQEIRFFFPEFDEAAFFAQEEPQLRAGSLVFDPAAYVHHIQQPTSHDPSL
jgi:hypothetical protein